MSKIIGYREVDYTNPKTNKHVSGFELFIVSPIDDKIGEGFCWRWRRDTPTRPAFINTEVFQKIVGNVKTKLLNVECKPLYNEYGGIENIEFFE